MSNFYKPLLSYVLMGKKENGFSIAETIAAVAIVSIVAAGSLSSYSYMKSLEVKLREGGACSVYLDSTFKRLESYGTSAQFMAPGVTGAVVANPPLGTPIPSGMVLAPMAPAPILSMSGSQLAPMAYQALMDFPDSSQPTKLRTAAMYTGSVALISALYNNNSTICTASFVATVPSSASAEPTSLVPMIPPDIAALPGNAFQVEFTIKPTSLSANAVQACTAPGYTQGAIAVGPMGLDTTTTQMQNTPPGPVNRAGQVIAAMDPAGLRSNIGFSTQIKVSYVSKAGPINCTGTKIYSYPADVVPPNPPTLAATATVGVPAANWGPDNVTLTFAYTAGNQAKPGTVLMCRDESTIVGGATLPRVAVLNPDPSSSLFVPCERVTACGMTSITTGDPTTYPTITVLSPSAFSISKSWINTSPATPNHGLPRGCRLQIRVHGVDPAGNVSAIGATYPDITHGLIQLDIP